MTLIQKYIRIIGLFFLFCVSACSKEIPDDTVMPTTSEKVVLRLNVQHEPVVQTRATDTPADDEMVESVDFLVFNSENKIVLHQHPSLEWTGTAYKLTVNISSATGRHTMYLVANHPMAEGEINTLQDLENQICESETALVTPPYVMATNKITLPALNATAIRNAMDGSSTFNLKRNVAKFSVEVAAYNFTLSSVQWAKCPTQATVLSEADYTSTQTESINNLAPATSPIHLYQIHNIGSDPHQGFHIIVSGEYTAADGTKKEGYYKLRLIAANASGNKEPLTSIVGNNYYKINIQSVSGYGANSLENAKANGFTNDMEALIILDYTGSHFYQEDFLQNGYQMGFESSHWFIYSDELLESFPLGYCYRIIRNQSLSGYTTFDPDYPNRNRGGIKVKTNGLFVTEMITCNDTPDNPVEMELYYTDLNDMPGNVFTSTIQYGVLQKKVIVERKPSINRSYTVIPMLDTYYGEIIGNLPWMGIAEQRHEGTTLFQQIDSDNDHIFIHIKENDTGVAREGKVRLFGKNGYYELRIRQESS